MGRLKVTQSSIRRLGFTLLELLVSLAIISSLVLFSTGIGYRFYETQVCHAESLRLFALVKQARSSALNAGTVELRPQGGGNWALDLLLVDIGDGDHILSRFDAIHSPLKLQWRGFTRQDSLRFDREIAHSATSGRFELYATKRCASVIVNRLGRVRLEQS